MSGTQHIRRQIAPAATPRYLVFFASSASTDRRSEDIRVLAIIITELEFSDVERHVFAAHFMECADHAALD
jgi:hypothetical protein